METKPHICFYFVCNENEVNLNAFKKGKNATICSTTVELVGCRWFLTKLVIAFCGPSQNVRKHELDTFLTKSICL